MAGLFDSIVQEDPRFVDSAEKYAQRAEAARDEAVSAAGKAEESAKVAQDGALIVISKVKEVQEIHDKVVIIKEGVEKVGEKAQETVDLAIKVYDQALELGTRFEADRDYVDFVKSEVDKVHDDVVFHRDETITVREETKAIRDTTTGIRDATLVIKNETSGIRDDAKKQADAAKVSADKAHECELQSGRFMDDSKVYSIQSKDHADRAKGYMRQIESNISISQGLIDQNQNQIGYISSIQDRVESTQVEVLLARDEAVASADSAKNSADSATASAKEAETQKYRASVYADQALVYKDQAGIHEAGAEDWYEKTKGLYQEVVNGYAYRGLWNPNTGSYPNPLETNSTWDLVLSPEQLETGCDFGGHTWFFGDRLVYVKHTDSYHRLPSGSTVLSVNGKKGSVVLTADDVGAMKEGGTYSTLRLNDWFRSNGSTGWYSESYGGGIHMSDHDWIRVFNGKKFAVGNTNRDSIYTQGGVMADGGFYDGTDRVYSPKNKPTAADVGVYSKEEIDNRNFIPCVDNRTNNSSPIEYRNQALTAFFTDKNNPAVGWHSGITVKGWFNGYTVWQMLSSANPGEPNNKFYLRSGLNDVWGDYAEIYTSLNKPTAADVGVYTKEEIDGKTSVSVLDNSLLDSTPIGYDGKAMTPFFTDRGTPRGGWTSGITVKGWTNDYNAWQIYSNAATGDSDNKVYFRAGNNNNWGPQAEFYTTLNPPKLTAKDVNAMPLDGSDIGHSLVINTNGGRSSIQANANSTIIGHDNSGYYLYLNYDGTLKWGLHGIYHQGNKPTVNELVGDKTAVNGTIQMNNKVTQFTGYRAADSDLNNRIPTDAMGWGYTGVNTTSDIVNGFPMKGNNNGILSFNTHAGTYGHQIGMSSDGKVYHRSQEGRFTDWAEFYTSSNPQPGLDPTKFLSTEGGTITGTLSIPRINGQLKGHTTGSTDGVEMFSNSRGDWGYSTILTGNGGMFPTLNNANGILTVNTHAGDYGHQVGFSGSGKMYHRFQDAGKVGEWGEVYTSLNPPPSSGGGSGGAVSSVNGKIGDVTLGAEDVGAMKAVAGFEIIESGGVVNFMV